jgi:hypothetical protein
MPQPDWVPFAFVAAFANSLFFILVCAVYFLPAGLLVANAWKSGQRQFSGPICALPACPGG